MWHVLGRTPSRSRLSLVRPRALINDDSPYNLSRQRTAKQKVLAFRCSCTQHENGRRRSPILPKEVDMKSVLLFAAAFILTSGSVASAKNGALFEVCVDPATAVFANG